MTKHTVKTLAFLKLVTENPHFHSLLLFFCMHSFLLQITKQSKYTNQRAKWRQKCKQKQTWAE